MLRVLYLIPVLAAVGCVPQRASAPRPSVERVYRVVDGDTLRAAIYAAAPVPTQGAVAGGTLARPAVVLAPTDAWSNGPGTETARVAAAFARAGFVAIAVDLRGADATHTPVDALVDLCSAIQWVRANADSLGVDRARIAGFGESSGGHLAVSTVTVGCPFASLNRGFDALLLVSPILDVSTDSAFGALLNGRAAPTAMSPSLHVREAMPPIQIAQGERDQRAPLLTAQRFCLAVTTTRQRCELRVYSELGHLLAAPAENGAAAVPDRAAHADAIASHIAFLRSVFP